MCSTPLQTSKARHGISLEAPAHKAGSGNETLSAEDDHYSRAAPESTSSPVSADCLTHSERRSPSASGRTSNSARSPNASDAHRCRSRACLSARSNRSERPTSRRDRELTAQRSTLNAAVQLAHRRRQGPEDGLRVRAHAEGNATPPRSRERRAVRPGTLGLEDAQLSLCRRAPLVSERVERLPCPSGQRAVTTAAACRLRRGASARGQRPPRLHLFAPVRSCPECVPHPERGLTNH
jgi:hypothetical protein